MKNKLIHICGGQVCGKAWEKKMAKCGKGGYSELSPLRVSCPQSYPQGYPRVQQTFIPQSTVSTTITTLINIY